MSERAVLVSVLCFGGLVPAASAQGGGYGFIPPEWTLQPPPPSPFSDAVFGALVVGEFTNDLSLDAVVMSDGHPSLLISPEVVITSIVGTAGNDIAPIRLSGGTRDMLLLASSSGLELLEYDTTYEEWDATTLSFSAWAGARAVRTGDMGWTTYMDVAGLASSTYPKKVLTLFGNSTGGLFATAGFDTSGDAYTLELLDWDGDGDEEIAVVTSVGIEIWGPAGGYFDHLELDPPPTAIAVMRGEGTESDRLAYVLTDAEDEQWLGIFDENGDEGLYILGSSGIVRAIAGDTDGDGDADLVLTSQNETEFCVIENVLEEAEEYTFDPFNAIWVPFGDPERNPTGNQAGIALADFDGDTDLDILAPAQGSGTIESNVFLARNEFLNHRQWVPGVTGSHFKLNETTTPVSGLLKLYVTEPSQLLTAGGGLTPWLKISIWRSLDHELASEQEAFLVPDWIDLTDPFPAFIAIETGEVSTHDYTAIHSVVVRQVLLDGSFDIVQQKPALVMVNASEENYVKIRGQPNVDFTHVRSNEVIRPEGPGSSRTGGGMAGGPTLPPPAENQALRPFFP